MQYCIENLNLESSFLRISRIKYLTWREGSMKQVNTHHFPTS
jgi:hypothetical protein